MEIRRLWGVMGADPGAREDLLLVRRPMFRHLLRIRVGAGKDEVQPSAGHQQTLFRFLRNVNIALTYCHNMLQAAKELLLFLKIQFVFSFHGSTVVQN